MKSTSRISTIAALLGLAALTALPPPGRAQQPAPPQQEKSAGASALEPDAVAALNRMGAYLRTLTAFSLKSETTIDEVTDDGMKLQFAGMVTMQVKRPNGLRAEVNSDRKHRQLVYDGKTLTVYGERIGYYATVPAHTLPPACAVTVLNGITYQNCGGVWYQPQYMDTSVQYVVVNAPR